MKQVINYTITETIARHPEHGELTFESARQDRRIYYRLLVNGGRGGSLATERAALETIDYWRSKGWVR